MKIILLHLYFQLERKEDGNFKPIDVLGKLEGTLMVDMHTGIWNYSSEENN